MIPITPFLLYLKHPKQVSFFNAINIFGFFYISITLSVIFLVDAPVVKTYGQPKTSVKDHVNSKRQVFLRIKDQGSISFDISSSHPTHTIAECMAALVPRSNEFEKLNKNWEIKLKKKNTELVKKDELLNETEERCRVLEEAVQQLANVIGNSEPGEEESGQMSLLATVLLGNKGKKKKEITVGQKKE